jgi:putative transposase
MLRRQAFKYELMPTGQQQRQMRRFAGARRFVFNTALALQEERHARGETRLGYTQLCEALKQWKAQPETAWLNESPSQSLQQALKDLGRAYANFFDKRAAFPTFKKKGVRDSFRYPQGYTLDQSNSRLCLPKLGWLRYRNSRGVLGTVKNVTLGQSGGKWYASIQTEREVEQPVHPSTHIVGIDVGITRFATLSDGAHIEALNTFRQHQQRLSWYQRAMSRKTKFSSNWKKAKARVQKIHARIANVRRDFLHKSTTAISKNHAIVCIEDLQVRNMSKSAAGSSKAPGRNVKAKSGLNKAILDQGWFEFRRQLEYKQVWLGGEVLAVPARNTSRTCPACAHVSAENRRTQVRFACVECGYENNADLVGAINVLAAGHAVLARGEWAQSGRSVKQEPTEATTQELAHA